MAGNRRPGKRSSRPHASLSRIKISTSKKKGGKSDSKRGEEKGWERKRAKFQQEGQFGERLSQIYAQGKVRWVKKENQGVRRKEDEGDNAAVKNGIKSDPRPRAPTGAKIKRQLLVEFKKRKRPHKR